MEGCNLTLSSKYKPNVITDIQVLGCVFMPQYMFYMQHILNAVQFYSVICTLSDQGPVVQNLSARYIQFRVIKNVIYICNLLLLTKNCCFCICMPFGCSRVCGTPPPFTGIMNLIIKVMTAKVYINDNMSAFGVFLKNHSDIKLRRGSDFDSTCRPTSVSTSMGPQLECSQPRPLLLDPPHLSVQEGQKICVYLISMLG